MGSYGAPLSVGLFVVLFVGSIAADCEQLPQWLWDFERSISVSDIATGVDVNQAGDIVVAGSTDGAFPGFSNAGSYDQVVMKFSPNGTLEWTYQNGTAGNDRLYDVALTDKGEIFAVGEIESTHGHGQASFSAFVQKLLPDGVADWVLQIPLAQASARAVELDQDGNVIVGGSFWPHAGFVAKVSADGALAWISPIGSDGVQLMLDVAINPAGKIFAAGLTNGAWAGFQATGRYDALIVSLLPNGTRDQAWQFGADGVRDGMALAFDKAGAMFMGGRLADGNGDFHGRYYVMKILPDGTSAWTIERDISSSEMVVDKDGGVVITGIPVQGAVDDLNVTKIAADGNVSWTAAFGKPGRMMQPKGMKMDPMGNIVIAGGSLSTTTGRRGVFVAKAYLNDSCGVSIMDTSTTSTSTSSSNSTISHSSATSSTSSTTTMLVASVAPIKASRAHIAAAAWLALLLCTSQW